MALTTLESQLENRARWDSETAEMLRYARSCRNREKRSYAIAYAAHLLTGAQEPSTFCYALGYMAAQAVRLSLAEIHRAASESRETWEQESRDACSDQISRRSWVGK